MLLPRDFIYRCARSFPHKVAYIDGDRTRTWREVDERSERLAAGLQQLGVGKGDAVAILSHDHIEVAEHWCACLKIGALRTGINWRYAPNEMLHIIHDSDAKALIIQDSCVPLIEEYLTQLRAEGRELIGFGESHGLAIDYEMLIHENDASPERPELSEDDLIAISYTTGTTGLPKGALWTQRSVREALIHTVLATGLRHEDVWASVAPETGVPILFTAFGLVNGMTTVLPNGDFDARTFLELVEQHRVTSTIFVVTMLRRVVEEAKSDNFDISSLRLICYGSMSASPTLIRSAYHTLGCEFQQWYGATEGTGGWYTFLREEGHQVALSGEPELLTSCGKPLLHVEVAVQDPDGDPLPAGEIGEVCVRGDVVMKGYLNRPEENAEAFWGDWLRSGDLGYFDNRGYLYLVDRRKFMIISGGFNVYPVVVENVLAEHPAVNEVTVVGAPHPEWGEAVVGVVTLQPEMEATPEDLIEFCKGKVGKWEVPKHIEIVPELPRGVTGKVPKHEVRNWFRDQPNRLPWGTA